jgi:chaperonin GroEL
MNLNMETQTPDLRFELLRGVDVLAAAVKATLGPAGCHVVLERADDPPRITKDGVSVARTIQLKNRFEDLAVQLVKQAAQRTADEVGDGTSTTTVLAHALLREGIKHLAVGVDPTQLKHGMEQAATAALADLRKHSVACCGPDMLKQVATLAANGDSHVGRLVADALHRVGTEGVVHIEPGRGLRSELHLVDGLQWETGPVSMRFATDQVRQRVRLEKPWVLVAFGTIEVCVDLVDLLERLAKNGGALVIAAEDFSEGALQLLCANAGHASLKLVAIKAPWMGERRREGLVDLALATGTQPLNPLTGHTLKKLALSELGTALAFEASERHSVFLGGGGKSVDLHRHIESLRNMALAADSEVDRAQARERRDMLATAVASIRVGAVTELEYQEISDRLDDALHSARAASREGLVPGGGVAYLRARAAASSVPTDSEDVAAGVAVLVKALSEPFLQIVGNAGMEALPELSLIEGLPVAHGLDVVHRRYGDMLELGIMDPTSVVCSALRNAVSVAGMLLTTDCAITADGIHHAKTGHAGEEFASGKQ